MGMRDVGQFGVEHASEGEQVVALVLQRHAPCCTDRVAEGERLFGEGFSAVAGQGCAISWPPLAAISAMQSHIPGPRLLP